MKKKKKIYEQFCRARRDSPISTHECVYFLPLSETDHIFINIIITL